MDFVSIVLIFLICVGVGFVFYSIIKKDEKESDDFLKVEAVNALINKSIEEADSAIEQLNGLSNDVFKEFEEKYQELLFLYQLIDEKKIMTETNSSYNKKIDNKSKEFKFNNSNLDEIKKLQAQGMSLSEISKKLGMGQGEVKFIMELGKTR